MFEGKAKSILVETDRYVVHLARYIHLNPVKAKLVVKPDEWMYSDYFRWVDNNNPSDGLKPSDGFLALRDSYFGGGDNYRKFVEEYDYKVDVNLSKYFLE